MLFKLSVKSVLFGACIGVLYRYDPSLAVACIAGTVAYDGMACTEVILMLTKSNIAARSSRSEVHRK